MYELEIIHSQHTEFDCELFEQNIGLTAGVTGRYAMLTPPRNLTPTSCRSRGLCLPMFVTFIFFWSYETYYCLLSLFLSCRTAPRTTLRVRVAQWLASKTVSSATAPTTVRTEVTKQKIMLAVPLFNWPRAKPIVQVSTPYSCF
jgi:hypothetical protein